MAVVRALQDCVHGDVQAASHHHSEIETAFFYSFQPFLIKAKLLKPSKKQRTGAL